MPQRGRPPLFSGAELRSLRREHRHLTSDRALQNAAYAERATSMLGFGQLITPSSWLVEAGRMLAAGWSAAAVRRAVWELGPHLTVKEGERRLRAMRLKS